MIRAVIFDIDGTLLDSVDLHARAWQEVLARHGHDVPFEDVRRQIGKGGDNLLPVFLSRRELERLQEKIEKERSELFKQKYLPLVRPFPKVRELFQRILADGKRIALASSGKKDEVEVYEKIAGIDDLIGDDDVTSSGDAEHSKPDPDIFHAALGKLGKIPKDEVIAVGDTPYDAEAAGKAGLRTIGMLCGGFPEADLRAAGCIAIYRDPADLLAHYETSPIARG
ncbi:MAG TPA: HAD family hydrolase [Isosphaeraceae bacterium]